MSGNEPPLDWQYIVPIDGTDAFRSVMTSWADAFRLADYEILERVRMAWDLSGDLPVPRFPCSCGCYLWHPERFEWFEWPEAEDHRLYGRINVDMKCTGCSRWSRHGIAVDEVTFRRTLPMRYGWREFLKSLRNE